MTTIRGFCIPKLPLRPPVKNTGRTYTIEEVRARFKKKQEQRRKRKKPFTLRERVLSKCRIIFREQPEAIYEVLKKQYTQKYRKYHNLKHIEACLNESREYFRWEVSADSASAHEKPIDDLLLVDLAILFHDFIYDPKGSDNEESSAEVFRQMLGHNLRKESAQEVYNLILMTKHNKQPRTKYEKLIVDIDLSILGQPKEVFEAYERAIRKEYSWVSDDEFCIGRLKVLKDFLSRKRIYSTPYFFDKYEKQARINLAWSIRMLIKP